MEGGNGRDRLETRELAYFVAVAEELHFGRAAERLGIAQPPLSRAIKRLERRTGVELLERTSRSVALTGAGRVMLQEARKALDAVEAVTRRTRRAAAPSAHLVLVCKPGGDAGLLPQILREYESRPGSVPVELLICGIGEQAAMLRDGRADVALLHRPYDDLSGFDTEELLVESQVVVVPKGHRLAGRASVRLAELDGEPLPRWPGMSAAQASGPAVRSADELTELVSLGRLVAVLPESVRLRLTGDLACVPVRDAPQTTVLIGWPERSRSRPLAELVAAAVSVASSRSRLAVAGNSAG